MKQKRQTGAGGMIQASNMPTGQFKSHSTKWVTPVRELHGYDGPMQYSLSSNNSGLLPNDMKSTDTEITGTYLSIENV